VPESGRNYRITPEAKTLPVKVVGSSTFGIYPKIDAQKTYNMFISQGWLINMPGYKRALRFPSGQVDSEGNLIYLSTGEGRGCFVSTRGNLMIVVINEFVYSISSTLGITKLPNNLSTSTGEVFIDENLSNQICIVDGTDAYIYNYSLPANLTAQNINTAHPDLIPNYVSYHNTFFLFGNALTTSDGSKWHAYSRATDTTISETTELTLQTKPNFALAVKRIPSGGNNVLVFGKTVAEIWTQVGGLQNYRRVSSLNIDSGCISVSTIAAAEKSVFWLGITEKNAPAIMKFTLQQGFERISTDGIDNVLDNISRPDRSTAAIYRQNGHLFYQLTFYDQEDNFTLIYDTNTSLFFHSSDQHLNFHPSRETVFFNSRWFFASINDPYLYEQSQNFTTIDESLGADENVQSIWEIQRIRICDTIRSSDTVRFRASSFVMPIEQGNDPGCQGATAVDYVITEDSDQIITESGALVITEDSITSLQIGYCPRVDLSFSVDGGRTWSNTVGQVLNFLGHRKNILNWQNLGMSNEFIIKLRFWGMQSFVCGDGELEVF